ncbi:MAG: type 4a pilus biogenesis protein PilO [Candidatus Omnitrophota bacterium]
MNFYQKLTNREKAILFLTVGIIAFFVCYQFMIEPIYRYWQASEKEIDVVRANIQKSIRLLEKQDTISAEYEAIEKNLKSRGSDEREKTFVFEQLDMIGRGSGVKIVTMRPRAVEEKDFYKKFVVMIETESDMGALMKFIYQVKESPAALNIERFSLNTRTYQDRNVIRSSMLVSRITID